MSGPRAWEADEFNVQRARDIYGSTSFRPAELLTTPPTSLPQAAGAGEDIHALRSFEYAQGHQYPVIQTLGSAFQYQPETLQYSPQRTSQISHQAQTQFPYDYMPQYQPEQRQPDSYGDYQQSLKETNQKTSEGRLIEAAESLKNLSKWFLGNVKGLGLSRVPFKLVKANLFKDLRQTWKNYAASTSSSGGSSTFAGLPCSNASWMTAKEGECQSKSSRKTPWKISATR